MTDFECQLQMCVNKKNIFKDEPMSKHTSFKIGGIADYFVIVESVKELKDILKLAKKNNIKFTIIGNGTNLLVKDSGIRGIVIKLNLKSFKIRKNSNEAIITVESGLTLASLANIALKEEIEGLEFLFGIPGTIGGAIRMNAGAYGKEMKDVVQKTRYITYDGEIKTLSLEEHEFEYRKSIFSKINGIIIDSTIIGYYGEKNNILSRTNEYTESRRNSQPLDYPNAGSTFKRIEGVPTAKLIDDCGLKGYSIGDAEVSTKHAGFIINKGNATADDVLKLVDYVKKVVKEKFNKDIELEIIVIGDDNI